jgi:small subunit ribosomal protein S20
MPHHKSAVKRLRTAETSRRRNVAIKSVLRKQLKRQRAAGAEGAELLPETHATLDRAVRKGVIPKARAARLKSRTARKANAGS